VGAERPRRVGGVAASIAATFVLAVVLVAVGAGLAGTISGTPKSDTLRGTAKADTLDGRGGNDKLYGLGGKDRLRGGAGADRLEGGRGSDVLACGPGRDVAVADPSDRVGKDCEAVTGRAAPPPAPPPASPAPPPAAGNYSGTTSQGKPIALVVSADGKTVVELELQYRATCGPNGSYAGAVSTAVAVPIQPDGSFTAALPAMPLGTSNGSVTGKFNSPGHVGGTLVARPASDVGDRRIECDTGAVTWTASRR
jgi:Ca2+-binding RTX toxin-like protein